MPRQEHIDGDIVLFQLVREVERHRHHAGFGSLIGHLAALRSPAGVAVGTDANDASLPPAEHRLHEALDDAKGTKYMCVEHRVPVANLGLKRRHAAVRRVQVALSQARIIDYHIDGTESIDSGLK